ncbi:MAG: CDP-alcohol phosphatidyltransferase family protein [Lysobacteraceae bacterium]
MNLRQLPNAITIARMLAVLPLVWCLHHGEYRAALAIALLAGLSDGIDGWLAKRYGWRTRLGGLLDPLADKLLLDASFIGLWLAHAVPTWLLLLVLGRDLVIVAGASAYHFLIGPLKGQPSWLGKATTVVQIALVVCLLALLAWQNSSGQGSATGLQWTLVGVWIVALFTLASGVDYVLRWGVRTRDALRARQQ